MIELKPCKCGGEGYLHKTSRGKFWFECGCCWTQSHKFWSTYEAMLDWNRCVEEEEEEETT